MHSPTRTLADQGYQRYADGTIRLRTRDLATATIWVSFAQYFALVGHRKVRVVYNVCTGEWDEAVG